MPRAPTLAGTVTLLTDFGLSDPYVGILKGVLLHEAPNTRIVDLSHDVPPQDIRVAAFWLAHAYPFFPVGSVHLCVVDPGVGSARVPIAFHQAGHLFVGPDNGVFSDVLAGVSAPRVRRIDASGLGLDVPSRTFHGRDVFAPVAARLASRALRLEQLGPQHEPLVELRPPVVSDAGGVTGMVIFADRFGNLVTDIPAALVDRERHVVEIAGRALRVVGTYVEAKPGECVGLVSSFGTLEVAQRDGHAAGTLGSPRGAPVRLLARPPV